MCPFEVVCSILTNVQYMAVAFGGGVLTSASIGDALVDDSAFNSLENALFINEEEDLDILPRRTRRSRSLDGGEPGYFSFGREQESVPMAMFKDAENAAKQNNEQVKSKYSKDSSDVNLPEFSTDAEGVAAADDEEPAAKCPN